MWRCVIILLSFVIFCFLFSGNNDTSCIDLSEQVLCHEKLISTRFRKSGAYNSIISSKTTIDHIRKKCNDFNKNSKKDNGMENIKRPVFTNGELDKFINNKHRYGNGSELIVLANELFFMCPKCIVSNNDK